MAQRKRWSHSAFEDFVRCGESYRLKRVVQVPEVPNLAGIGGSAFHLWTEEYDKRIVVDFMGESGIEDIPSVEHILNELLAEEEEKSELPREQFRTFGRKTKDLPNGQDIPYWRDVLLPEMCEKYIQWRAATPWRIATDLPPDRNGNTVGIEYEIRYTLNRTEIRGFIDRVEYDENGNLGAVDLKTWSRKRTTAQLPGYVVGLQAVGVPAVWGSYYHARKGESDPPRFFTSWNQDRLVRLYDQAAKAEMLGIYLPKPSDDCASFCSVAAHCEFAL